MASETNIRDVHEDIETTKSEKVHQPLKWWGGKKYLAPRIIDLMPKHLHYVEPYGGGLAVLLNKNPSDPRHQWTEKGYEQGISEVGKISKCN